MLKIHLCARNGQLLVIGTEPHWEGKLVISLEPQFQLVDPATADRPR